MPTTQAVQSADIGQLLDAVSTVLINGDGLRPATGVNEQYITENYTDFHPRSGEPYEITYAILPETPIPYHGAGRLGHPSFITLEVAVYTRLEIDVASSDYAWSRDTTWGALVMRQRIVDLLQDQFLFSQYNAITHLPEGSILTIEPIQQIECPRPRKPSPNTSDQSTDVGGYGLHTLLFQLKYVMPLTN